MTKIPFLCDPSFSQMQSAYTHPQAPGQYPLAFNSEYSRGVPHTSAVRFSPSLSLPGPLSQVLLFVSQSL